MHLGETTFSIDFIEDLYCSLLHTNHVNMTIPNGHILRIWVTWLAVIYRTIRPLIRRCCAESGAWAQKALDLHALADFLPRMHTCWEVMMSWDSYSSWAIHLWSIMCCSTLYLVWSQSATATPCHMVSWTFCILMTGNPTANVRIGKTEEIFWSARRGWFTGLTFWGHSLSFLAQCNASCFGDQLLPVHKVAGECERWPKHESSAKHWDCN